MSDTIRRLRELEAEATPGPWPWRLVLRSKADANLVVAARNALPLLLDIAEAAVRVRGDAGAIVQWKGQPPTPMWQLMEALSALDDCGT